MLIRTFFGSETRQPESPRGLRGLHEAVHELVEAREVKERLARPERGGPGAGALRHGAGGEGWA